MVLSPFAGVTPRQQCQQRATMAYSGKSARRPELGRGVRPCAHDAVLRSRRDSKTGMPARRAHRRRNNSLIKNVR